MEAMYKVEIYYIHVKREVRLSVCLSVCPCLHPSSPNLVSRHFELGEVRELREVHGRRGRGWGQR